MSAIVRTFTPEGFVIAADGRATNLNLSIQNETEQKIFPINPLCGPCALSICGAVDIASDDRSHIAVDVQTTIRESVKALERRKIKNLLGYAVRLSRDVHTAMKQAVLSGSVADYEGYNCGLPEVGMQGHTITSIWLDGDSNNKPSSIAIRLFHENGILAEPEVSPQDLMIGGHRIYGSILIADILFNPENEVRDYIGTTIFQAHRPKWMYCEDIRLADAIDRSKRYIEACSDPEAVTLDKECARIGGRIHIATVTANEGFKWVPGFEPVTPA
jgi:hypothetical protein